MKNWFHIACKVNPYQDWRGNSMMLWGKIFSSKKDYGSVVANWIEHIIDWSLFTACMQLDFLTFFQVDFSRLCWTSEWYIKLQISVWLWQLELIATVSVELFTLGYHVQYYRSFDFVSINTRFDHSFCDFHTTQGTLSVRKFLAREHGRLEHCLYDDISQWRYSQSCLGNFIWIG